MPVEAVAAPDAGVWRIGRAPDPLARSAPLDRAELDQPTTGNRFDSPIGGYQTLYFASTLEGCFGETLARFRPDPALQKLLRKEWEEAGFMCIGDIPADWRQRRMAVNVKFPAEGRFSHGVRFLDVEAIETREELRSELAEVLAYYGYKDLDISIVRGADRRVTRWIGQWAYDRRTADGQLAFAGVRYLSRLNSDWECWAVFNDVPIAELDRKPILANDPALQSVAKTYGLVPY